MYYRTCKINNFFFFSRANNYEDILPNHITINRTTASYLSSNHSKLKEILDGNISLIRANITIEKEHCKFTFPIVIWKVITTQASQNIIRNLVKCFPGLFCSPLSRYKETNFYNFFYRSHKAYCQRGTGGKFFVLKKVDILFVRRCFILYYTICYLRWMVIFLFNKHI